MTMTDATLLDHFQLPGGYWQLLLKCPEIAHGARPGQFVHARIPTLWKGALRRPFSICKAEGDTLLILYKVVGKGTLALSKLQPGHCLNLIGPLGNGFPLPKFPSCGGVPEGTESRGRGGPLGGRDAAAPVPVLVGGGFGVAPLLFLASRLPTRGLLFAGGRTAADILLAEEFQKIGWDVRFATEDGSLGMKGLVTNAIDEWLHGQSPTPDLEFFSCGPDGLLKAVGERAMRLGKKAWLSLDTHMGCGVGACLACIQTLRNPDGTSRIGRVCKDGPVFESREIVWD